MRHAMRWVSQSHDPRPIHHSIAGQAMSYMSAKDLADKCEVDRRTVYNWAARGVVPGAHKLGGVWRFDVSKVAAWIRRREQAPCPSIAGAKSGGSASKPKALRSDNQLERLLGLPH